MLFHRVSYDRLRFSLIQLVGSSRSELVQLKLNITRFYEVKYALDFGGGFYPHRSKNKEPPLIEVRGLGILIKNNKKE